MCETYCYLVHAFLLTTQESKGVRMIRICAWCQQEGKREILGMSPGNMNEPESHGICQDHVLRLRQSYKPNRRLPIPTTTLFSSAVSH